MDNADTHGFRPLMFFSQYTAGRASDHPQSIMVFINTWTVDPIDPTVHFSSRPYQKLFDLGLGLTATATPHDVLLDGHPGPLGEISRTPISILVILSGIFRL